METVTGENSSSPLSSPSSSPSSAPSGSSSASAALTELIMKELPLFIRFPHIGYDPLSVCRSKQADTLLGWECLFIPGMVVGFCYSYDLARIKGPKIYFATSLVGKKLKKAFYVS